MHRVSVAGFLSVLAATIAATAGQAALVINELLYDPEGADAGKEFVEIMNTGPYAVTLDGVVLEAGDGARPADWDLIWTGSSERAIPPGGYYRIGADGPGAGESAQLKLQNGPDGVRLVKLGFELDRVGWGLHRYSDYFEQRPAPECRSGESLARAADGEDTNDNSRDFVVATPTPGRPNRPAVDWSIQLRGSDPLLPQPGETVLVHLTVTNLGMEIGLPPQVELDDVQRPILVGWDGTVAPGETMERAVVLTAPSIEGTVLWRACLVPSDPVPENDCDSVCVQVGVGEVRLTEILARPDTEGCEWLELGIEAPEGTRVEGLILDVRGRSIRLAPRRIDAATRIGLVTADSVVMRLRYPDVREGAFWSYEGAWPRLRDGRRGEGIADTLRIVSESGCVVEVALPGPAPAPGVSLERIDAEISEGPSAWTPCTDSDGATPGREAIHHGVRSRIDRLRASPRVIHPGGSSCRIEGTVGSEPGEVDLDLFDIQGRAVRSLIDDTWVAGSLFATWDGLDAHGRAVTPGIYVVVLEVRRSDGHDERIQAPVAVAPGEGQ